MDKTSEADVFAALSHPARRAILMTLRGGPRAASDLCEGLTISRPAASEHLQVLRQARLVRMERRGRERYYYLDPRPLADVGTWLNAALAFWTRRLNDLDALAQREREAPPR